MENGKEHIDMRSLLQQILLFLLQWASCVSWLMDDRGKAKAINAMISDRVIIREVHSYVKMDRADVKAQAWGPKLGHSKCLDSLGW